MTYRYSEEDLADIKKRQDANLGNFQRNSGRGLPEATVKAMEKGAGVKLDEHGAPVPVALPAAAPPAGAKKRKPKVAKLPVPSEQEECEWLMQWAKTQRFKGWPLEEILIHVPNGAYLGPDARTRAITMGKLKAIGLQPSVSDYILPVPLWTRKCPGLWLEMKRTEGGTLRAGQKTFLQRMLELGWRCEVAKGWVEASAIIKDHLRSATPR